VARHYGTRPQTSQLRLTSSLTPPCPLHHLLLLLRLCHHHHRDYFLTSTHRQLTRHAGFLSVGKGKGHNIVMASENFQECDKKSRKFPDCQKANSIPAFAVSQKNGTALAFLEQILHFLNQWEQKRGLLKIFPGHALQEVTL